MAVVCVSVVTGLASLGAPPPPVMADPAADQLPATVVEAPRWTADIRDAPLDRALVVFDINTHESTYTVDEESRESVARPAFSPLTLVGPQDGYRTFDPSESGGPWTGEWELSPDGRYVMTGHGQHTQLLDVTTGRTRMLRAGAPLSWSHDGRQAVLAHFDGDERSFPVTGQVRIVDIPSGDVLWSIPLAPGPLPRSVDAVLAPDNSTVLVQRHGDLYAYRRDTGVVWHRSVNILGLAGQLAWAPDGRSVTVNSSGLCQLAAETGRRIRCIGWKLPVSEMEFVTFLGSGTIVGWDGEEPVINSGRDVVHLARREVLVKAPQDARRFEIATTDVSWASRRPGPPDPGPALHRYRPIINIAGLVTVGVGVIVTGLRWWRRRARVAATPQPLPGRGTGS